MDVFGYSTDNKHIGNTLIEGDLRVTGDVDIDGDLVFNSVQANEVCIDGYCLPTAVGLPDQVITLNPDGKTSSWQDVNLPTASGRVIQNVFQMTNPRFNYTTRCSW